MLDFHVAKESMQGFYRISISNLRNVLELMLLVLYFYGEYLDSDSFISHGKWIDLNIELKHINWLNSRDNTPFFQVIVNELVKFKKFNSFNDKFQFINEIRSLYHELCDFNHIKGFSYSDNCFQQSSSSIILDGYKLNNYSEKGLIKYLKYRQKVIRVITILILLMYSIVLISDNDFEYGNEPLCFYYQEQIDLLFSILNEEEKEYFQKKLMVFKEGCLQNQE